MKTSWKIALIAGAIGIGGFSAHEARAGNFTHPLNTTPIGIWSIELALGQYADFTPASGVVLLDDITYTIKSAPCHDTSESACVVLNTDQIPYAELSAGTRYPMLSAAFGSWTYLHKWAAARFEHDHVYLTDWDGTCSLPLPPSEFVDHFAISHYGELIGLTSEFFQWGALNDMGPPLVWEPFFGMTGDHPLSLAIASVPASQSRHYQTPYIVKYGKLHFQQALLGNIIFAWVDLKGREVVPANPPDFGVSTFATGTTPGCS